MMHQYEHSHSALSLLSTLSLYMLSPHNLGSPKLMAVGDHMDFETTVRLEITVVLFAVIQQYQYFSACWFINVDIQKIHTSELVMYMLLWKQQVV